MQVLRQKIARVGTGRARADRDSRAGGAERAFPLALARAARDVMALALDVTALQRDRLTLAELVELLPERALILMLEDQGGEGLGLLVMSPAILSGLVEMLTTGRVTANPAPNRRPTRTDAAMLAGLIDSTLAGFEIALQSDPDRPWVEGWRYGSFLPDARTMTLLLDDGSFQVLRAEVSLSGGAKSGPLVLALPASRRMADGADDAAEAGADLVFAAHLTAQVEGTAARLDAVIGRLTLPLARLSTLMAGEVLPLPLAAIDRVDLIGADGRLVAEGRLGQSRGLRALRITTETGLDPVAVADAPRAQIGR